MPLISKSAGKGTALAAALQAATQAAAAAQRAAAARPVVVQQPVVRMPTGAPVMQSAPAKQLAPSTKKATGFVIDPTLRTNERNSSRYYGAGRGITSYQPPVGGGQAAEFYTPPSPPNTPQGYNTIRGEERRPDPRATAIQLESSPDYRTAMMTLGGFTGDLEIDAARHAAALREARKNQPPPAAAPVLPRGPILTPQEQQIQDGIGLPSISRAPAAPESPYPQPPPVYAPRYMPEGPGLRDAASLQPRPAQKDPQQAAFEEKILALEAQIEPIEKILFEGNPADYDADTLVALRAQYNTLRREWEQARADRFAEAEPSFDLPRTIREVWGYQLDENAEAVARDLGGRFSEWLEDHPGFAEWIQHRANEINRPYEWHTRNIGATLAMLAIFGDDFLESIPILGDIPGVERADDWMDWLGIRDDIIEVANNGYTAPNGVHFDGPRAIFEMLLGKATDELPSPVGFPLSDLAHGVAAIFFDPLTLAGPVGRVGRGASILGRGLALMDDAGRLQRVLGRGLQATGRLVEESGRGADTLLVETPFRVIRYGGRKWGVGRPGAIQLAPGQLEHNARLDLEAADDALRRVRGMFGDDAPMRPGSPDQPPLSPTRPQSNPPSAPRSGTAAWPEPSVEYPGGSGQLAQDVQTLNGYEARELIRQQDAAKGGIRYRPRPLNEQQQAAVDRIRDYESAGGVVDDLAWVARGTPGEAAPAPKAPKPGKAPKQPPMAAAVSDELPVLKNTDKVPEEPVTIRATGELVDTPPSITPKGTPRLATAIARQGDPLRVQNLNNPLLPMENLASPVAGRQTLFDDVVNMAMVEPTLVRQAEDFYAAVEPAVAGQLHADPWYRNWQWTDHQDIAITAPMTDDVRVALSAAFPNSRTPETARNMLVKEVAEAAAMIEAEAYHIAPGMRYYGFGVDSTVRRPRVLVNGAKQSWVDEDIRYLLERMVKTTDDAEAETIFNLLAKSRGARVITGNGRPYIAGVPQVLKDEILQRMRESRVAFQDALRAGDDDIAEVIDNGLIPVRQAEPDVVAQFEQGSLGNAPKSVAKVARQTREQVLKDSQAALRADAKELGLTPNELNAFTKEHFDKTVSDLSLKEINTIRQALRSVDEGIASTAPRVAQSEQMPLPDQTIDVRVGTPSPDDFVSRHGKPIGITAPDPIGAARSFVRRALDATVQMPETAVAENIHLPEIARYNELGGLTNAQTRDLDKVIDWNPPGAKPIIGLDGQPVRYRVAEALDHVKDWEERRLAKATTDEGRSIIRREAEAELQKIANMMRDLPPVLKDPRSKRVRKALTLHDTAMTYNREMRLFGPATGVPGFIGDHIGNSWAQIVNGNVIEGITSLSPRAVKRASDAWLEAGTDVHRAVQSMESGFHRETGMVVPLDLAPGFTTGEVATSGLPRVNQLAEGRNVVLRGATRLLAVPAIKAGRIATDLVNRMSAYETAFRVGVRDTALPSFEKLLKETGGVDADLWMSRIHAQARKKAGGKWHGMFSPEDVRTALDGVTNQNTKLARGWQSALVDAQNAAKKRSREIFFTYQNTNADEMLRRIFTFHYWQSRAYPMHFRAALRNPVLLNSYYKLWEWVGDQAEQYNLPPFIKDMVRFMGGPNGLYGLYNPIGILLPTSIMDMWNEEGEEWKVLLNQISPFIGAALSVGGIVDTPPNLIPTKATERWLLNFMNWMEANGHVPQNIPILSDILNDGTMYLDGAFTEQATNYILQRANEQFRDAVPVAGEYQPFDRGANEMDQLRSYLLMLMQERYGPNDTWASETWDAYAEAELALTSGGDNPLANEAEVRWAREGMYQNAFFWVPGGTSFRSEWRDTQMRLAQEGFDIAPEARTQEQRTAINNRTLAKSADTAWSVASIQYHNLGTPEQQAIWDTYYDIVFNPTAFRERDLVVWDAEGQRWTAMDTLPLIHMTDEARRQQFADQWLAQRPGGKEAMDALRAEREAFKAANPEYADFPTYQKGVFDQEDEPGGIAAWRTGMAEVNPNFERAMNEQRKTLERKGYTGASLEAELDQWATGERAFRAMIGEPWQLTDPAALPVYDQTQDPYANPLAQQVMGMDQQGGGGGSASTGPQPKFSDKQFEEGFAGVDAQRAFANLAAEEIYGDQWDYDKIANDPLADNGWIPKKHPTTAYYPNGSEAGTSRQRDRYYEWRAWMLATNPGLTAEQVSEDAWIDWELGIWQQVYQQGYANPGAPALWQRFLMQDDNRAA